MKIRSILLIVILFYAIQAKAQVDPVKRDTLNEVIITSNFHK